MPGIGKYRRFRKRSNIVFELTYDSVSNIEYMQSHNYYKSLGKISFSEERKITLGDIRRICSNPLRINHKWKEYQKTILSIKSILDLFGEVNIEETIFKSLNDRDLHRKLLNLNPDIQKILEKDSRISYLRPLKEDYHETETMYRKYWCVLPPTHYPLLEKFTENNNKAYDCYFLPIRQKIESLEDFSDSISKLILKFGPTQVVVGPKQQYKMRSSKHLFGCKTEIGFINNIGQFSSSIGQCKRCFVVDAPSNQREAIQLPSDVVNSINYIDEFVSKVIKNLPWNAFIHENDRIIDKIQSFKRRNKECYFLHIDYRKEGITKPRNLLKIMLKIIKTIYPNDFKLESTFFDDFSIAKNKVGLCRSSTTKVVNGFIINQEVDPKNRKIGSRDIPVRGHGLGMANALTTLMQIGLYWKFKEKFDIDCLFFNDDGVIAIPNSLEIEDTVDEILLEAENIGLCLSHKKIFTCDEVFEFLGYMSDVSREKQELRETYFESMLPVLSTFKSQYVEFVDSLETLHPDLPRLKLSGEIYDPSWKLSKKNFKNSFKDIDGLEIFTDRNDYVQFWLRNLGCKYKNSLPPPKCIDKISPKYKEMFLSEYNSYQIFGKKKFEINYYKKKDYLLNNSRLTLPNIRSFSLEYEYDTFEVRKMNENVMSPSYLNLLYGLDFPLGSLIPRYLATNTISDDLLKKYEYFRQESYMIPKTEIIFDDILARGYNPLTICNYVNNDDHYIPKKRNAVIYKDIDIEFFDQMKKVLYQEKYLNRYKINDAILYRNSFNESFRDEAIKEIFEVKENDFGEIDDYDEVAAVYDKYEDQILADKWEEICKKGIEDPFDQEDEKKETNILENLNPNYLTDNDDADFFLKFKILIENSLKYLELINSDYLEFIPKGTRMRKADNKLHSFYAFIVIKEYDEISDAEELVSFFSKSIELHDAVYDSIWPSCNAMNEYHQWMAEVQSSANPTGIEHLLASKYGWLEDSSGEDSDGPNPPSDPFHGDSSSSDSESD
jgi:hypothetical protein